MFTGTKLSWPKWAIITHWWVSQWKFFAVEYSKCQTNVTLSLSWHHSIVTDDCLSIEFRLNIWMHLILSSFDNNSNINISKRNVNGQEILLNLHVFWRKWTKNTQRTKKWLIMRPTDGVICVGNFVKLLYHIHTQITA